MWYRLFSQGRQVGFRKEVAGTPFYSQDGYAFSGAKLSYDSAAPELPLRTSRGERLFDGDVVELRPAPGLDYEERLALLRPSGSAAFARPGSRELEELDAWAEERAIPVRRRLGSVRAGPFYRRRYAPALNAAEARARATGPAALRWAAAVQVGAAASAALQLRLGGGVGPLATVLGAALSLALVAWADRRRAGRELGADFIGQLAPRAALLSGGFVAALVIASAWLGKGSAASPGEPALAASVLGGLTFLTTLGLCALVGQCLDHFGGSPPEPREPS